MRPRRTRSCASRPRHAQPTRSRCDHSPSSSLPPPPALPPAAPPSPAALRPAPLRGGGASAAAWTRTNHAAAAVLDWSCARPQPARPAEPPAGQRMTPHIHMHIHTHMHAHARTHTHRCPSLGQEGEGRWQEGQARVVGQLRGRELLRVRSASLPAGAAAASTPPAAYQASPKLQGAAPSTMPRAPPRIPAHGSRLDFPRSIYCPAEGEFDSDDNFVKKQPPTKKAPVARKPLAAAAARPVASSQPASMATTSSLHTAAGADKKAPAARKREPVGGYGARGRASRLLPAPSAAPSAELSCRWPPPSPHSRCRKAHGVRGHGQHRSTQGTGTQARAADAAARRARPRRRAVPWKTHAPAQRNWTCAHIQQGRQGPAPHPAGICC